MLQPVCLSSFDDYTILNCNIRARFNTSSERITNTKVDKLSVKLALRRPGEVILGPRFDTPTRPNALLLLPKIKMTHSSPAHGCARWSNLSEEGLTGAVLWQKDAPLHTHTPNTPTSLSTDFLYHYLTRWDLFPSLRICGWACSLCMCQNCE